MVNPHKYFKEKNAQSSPEYRRGTKETDISGNHINLYQFIIF